MTSSSPRTALTVAASSLTWIGEDDQAGLRVADGEPVHERVLVAAGRAVRPREDEPDRLPAVVGEVERGHRPGRRRRAAARPADERERRTAAAAGRSGRAPSRARRRRRRSAAAVASGDGRCRGRRDAVGAASRGRASRRRRPAPGRRRRRRRGRGTIATKVRIGPERSGLPPACPPAGRGCRRWRVRAPNRARPRARPPLRAGRPPGRRNRTGTSGVRGPDETAGRPRPNSLLGWLLRCAHSSTGSARRLLPALVTAAGVALLIGGLADATRIPPRRRPLAPRRRDVGGLRPSRPSPTPPPAPVTRARPASAAPAPSPVPTRVATPGRRSRPCGSTSRS